jgi:hypothetical protein
MYGFKESRLLIYTMQYSIIMNYNSGNKHLFFTIKFYMLKQRMHFNPQLICAKENRLKRVWKNCSYYLN